MDSRVKEMWLHALRSGEYKQGRNFLRDGDRYCCLGVLCDLAESHGIVESRHLTVREIEDLANRDQREDEPFGYYSEPQEYIHDDAIQLPVAVQAWAGLQTADPLVPHGSGRITLANLNDRGHSFTEIADVIEQGL